TDEARQQPVPVHRGVPVIAAVEGRRQLPRRRHVRIRREVVRDLVRILLVHAGQGEVREALRRFRVEIGGVQRRGKKEEEQGGGGASHAREISGTSSTPRATTSFPAGSSRP